jgi:hypothetical protein
MRWNCVAYREKSPNLMESNSQSCFLSSLTKAWKICKDKLSPFPDAMKNAGKRKSPKNFFLSLPDKDKPYDYR